MMTDFHVADVVPGAALTYAQISKKKTLDFTWVHRWKGMDIISRLCARGFKPWVQNLDDTFVLTTVIMSLNIIPVFFIQYAVAHLHL